MRTDSSAAMRNVSMSRPTSPRASLMGLPASMHRDYASSLNRSWNRSTRCWRTAWRSYARIRRMGSVASTAAPMASSMAAGSAVAPRVAVSPVYLSVTSRSGLGDLGSLAR